MVRHHYRSLANEVLGQKQANKWQRKPDMALFAALSIPFLQTQLGKSGQTPVARACMPSPMRHGQNPLAEFSALSTPEPRMVEVADCGRQQRAEVVKGCHALACRGAARMWMHSCAKGIHHMPGAGTVTS